MSAEHEMRFLWRIAALIACVALICGAAFAWHTYKAKAPERRRAEAVRTSAERGDAKAQYDLGHIYFHGEGVHQSYAEALRWYRDAADQGYAKAQYGVGYMYDHGNGVPQNYAEAAHWYRRAADQGFAGAEVNLSRMYYFGQGVPQDYAMAILLSHKAADQGNRSGQEAVGFIYYSGHGVPQNYTEALRWYRKAADQGDARAQDQIGYMYLHGQGVPQDYAEAFHWTQKAAGQGDADAQAALGYMYAKGQGVPQSRSEAFRWFRKAAAQGDTYALSAVGEKLTPFTTLTLAVQLLGGLLLCFNFFSTNILFSGKSLRQPRQRLISGTGVLCLTSAALSWYGYTHDKIRRLNGGINAFTAFKWLLEFVVVALLIYIVRPKSKVLLNPSDPDDPSGISGAER